MRKTCANGFNHLGWLPLTTVTALGPFRQSYRTPESRGCVGGSSEDESSRTGEIAANTREHQSIPSAPHIETPSSLCSSQTVALPFHGFHFTVRRVQPSLNLKSFHLRPYSRKRATSSPQQSPPLHQTPELQHSLHLLLFRLSLTPWLNTARCPSGQYCRRPFIYPVVALSGRFVHSFKRMHLTAPSLRSCCKYRTP